MLIPADIVEHSDVDARNLIRFAGYDALPYPPITLKHTLRESARRATRTLYSASFPDMRNFKMRKNKPTFQNNIPKHCMYCYGKDSE